MEWEKRSKLNKKKGEGCEETKEHEIKNFSEENTQIKTDKGKKRNKKIKPKDFKS
jgi:hypothetical protein